MSGVTNNVKATDFSPKSDDTPGEGGNTPRGISHRFGSFGLGRMQYFRITSSLRWYLSSKAGFQASSGEGSPTTPEGGSPNLLSREISPDPDPVKHEMFETLLSQKRVLQKEINNLKEEREELLHRLNTLSKDNAYRKQIENILEEEVEELTDKHVSIENERLWQQKKDMEEIARSLVQDVNVLTEKNRILEGRAEELSEMLRLTESGDLTREYENMQERLCFLYEELNEKELENRVLEKELERLHIKSQGLERLIYWGIGKLDAQTGEKRILEQKVERLTRQLSTQNRKHSGEKETFVKRTKELEDKLRPVESLANGIQYVAGLTANIRGAVERVVSTKNAGTVLAVGLIAGAAFRLYKTYGA